MTQRSESDAVGGAGEEVRFERSTGKLRVCHDFLGIVQSTMLTIALF